MDHIPQFLIAAAIMLGVLIFVHETGHYLIGKWSGIAVEIYSIGFGPPIWSFKRGHTEYRLSWLPLGGFVKFYGMIASESIPDEVRGKDFGSAPLWAKYATVAAGPLANFLLAIILFSVLGFSGIPKPLAVIYDVQPKGVAAKAGLQFGDRITSINGLTISSWEEMSQAISALPGKQAQLQIERSGKMLDVEVVPDTVKGTDLIGRTREIGRIGVANVAVPAVIYIESADSIAATSGLRTGMRILSVTVDGETRDIQFFRELELYLRATIESGKSKITLNVAETHKDGTANLERAQAISLDLKTANKPFSLNDLGIQDGQLLVGDRKQVSQLQKNDRIIAWNDKALNSFFEYLSAQEDHRVDSVNLTIQRGFERMTIQVPLELVDRQMPSGKVEIYILRVQMLGALAEPKPNIERHDDLFSAVYFGVAHTWKQTKNLTTIIANLFTGQLPIKALGGPISIAVVAGGAAEAGWQVFIDTMAVISINLALLNFLPFPALDGGQILLFSFEAIRRRRLSEEALEHFQKIGFVIILALVVLATYNDVSRFWAAMIRNIAGAAGAG